MIDTKNMLLRHKFRIKIIHMKIVEPEHDTREQFIHRNRSLAGGIFHPKDTASFALRQTLHLLLIPVSLHRLSPFYRVRHGCHLRQNRNTITNSNS